MIENALCLCCGVRYIREEFHAGCSEIKSNHDCIPEDIAKWHNSSAYSEWVKIDFDEICESCKIPTLKILKTHNFDTFPSRRVFLNAFS